MNRWTRRSRGWLWAVAVAGAVLLASGSPAAALSPGPLSNTGVLDSQINALLVGATLSANVNAAGVSDGVDCSGHVESAAWQLSNGKFLYAYYLKCACLPNWDVGHVSGGLRVPLNGNDLIPTDFNGDGTLDTSFHTIQGGQAAGALGAVMDQNFGRSSADFTTSASINSTHIQVNFLNANGIFLDGDITGFVTNAPPIVVNGVHLGGSPTSFLMVVPGQPLVTDNVPPTTTLTRTPGPNAAGWNNTTVTLTFTATDTAQAGVTPSGVHDIMVHVNGVDACPPTGSTCTVVLSNEGIFNIDFHATDNAGNMEQLQLATVRIDKTKPVVSCTPTTNPSGQNIPPAGNNPRSGQNPDGFYALGASDNLTSTLAIFVSDTGSPFVAGPFASGTKIKLVQAPGVTPSVKPGPGVIDWHIQLKGDALVTATDLAGNTASATCLVPPPPK